MARSLATVINRHRGDAKSKVEIALTITIDGTLDAKKAAKIEEEADGKLDDLMEVTSGQRPMFPIPGDAEAPKPDKPVKGQKKLPLKNK